MTAAARDVAAAWRGIRRPSALELGLLLWVVGVAVAFYAQHELFVDLDRGRLLFVLAAIAGAVGMRFIDAAVPPEAEFVPRAPPSRTWSTYPRSSVVLLAFGLIASALGLYAVSSDGPFRAVVVLWITSIALVVGAAIRTTPGGKRVRMPRLTRSQAVELALVVGVLALALALRLPRLSAIPPDVHGDEASVGIDARALLNGGWSHLFEIGWAGLPQLGYGSVAVVMWLFGDDLFGLRMASLLEGVASVGLLYLVARRLFGVRPALIAAFVLAVEQWHIHFSRTGFHYMQAVPATLLVLFFAIRALDTRRALDFVLLGISVALCMIAYYAAREVAAIVAPYVLYRLVRERAFFRQHLLGFGWALVAFWIFLAPLFATLAHTSQPLLGPRAGSVWLFSPATLSHEKDQYGTSSTLRVLRIQAQNTLESVNRTGERTVQYGRVGQPLFDPWAAALLVPGLAYVISRIRQPRYVLLLFWILLPLLVTTFTGDAPFSPHMITVIPALAILPALVLDAGWRAAAQLAGRAGHAVVAALALVLGALALHDNYESYFHEQVSKIRVAAFPTLLARYALAVNDRYRVYLVSSHESFAFETVRFLVPDLDGKDLGGGPGLPLSPLPAEKGAAFVVDVSKGEGGPALRAIRRQYPHGTETSHVSATGYRMFVSYEVEHEGRARSQAAAP